MASSNIDKSLSTTSTAPRKTVNSAVVSGIAGLIASSVGKSIMHPVDTIKAKLQVISIPGSASAEAMKAEGPKSGSLMLRIVNDTIKAEGIRGLYRGFGIHVGGGIPAGGLYFGSYELFKKFSL